MNWPKSEAPCPRTRLLTLTGPGGTGKTRLSLQVAADVQGEYEHGVWLVELAPVTDPELVVSTAAGVFGLDGQTKQGDRGDIGRLSARKRAAAHSRQLRTSGRGLRAAGRRSHHHLSPLDHFGQQSRGIGRLRRDDLSFADPELTGRKWCNPRRSVGQSEAVQLFVERAMAAQPHFKLSDANARFVVQVVRRLDGIPLAIELAAARLKVFSLEQIAARLDQRFRLLTGGSRTAMPRQQTLRALIDWSYDLLEEEERELFRRLSVFMGGWTFDAAESVADLLDVYSFLPQLISKSLVTRESYDAAAFQVRKIRMLPNRASITWKQFASMRATA